jgi:C_GCAxxG_C_C family probable redox protein
MNDTGAPAIARARARELFLDEGGLHGCAETALRVLKEAYGLPDPEDATAAMALNGGIAWSGGTCGAIIGAALAIGMLAGRRIDDHGEAKRVARLLTADLLAAFEAEFGSSSCRELTGADLGTEQGHREFLEAGTWRRTCMRQLEMAVERLAPLGDGPTWDAAVASLDAS